MRSRAPTSSAPPLVDAPYSMSMLFLSGIWTLKCSKVCQIPDSWSSAFSSNSIVQILLILRTAPPLSLQPGESTEGAHRAQEKSKKASEQQPHHTAAKLVSL